jgi:hypothetical protein
MIKEKLNLIRGLYMKRLLIALAIVAVTAARSFGALEPEPSWAKLFEEVKAREFAKCIQPKLGDQITVERRIGSNLSGKITAISVDSVSIDGQDYKAAQLTANTCDTLFPLSRATAIATETVKSEQAKYMALKEGEARRVRNEAKMAEAARIAENQRIEDQRRSVSESVKAGAERDRIRAQRELEEGDKKAAKNIGIGVAVVGVLALFVYILPSLIAFKRGHINAGSICALNILLGWSLLGWVASLVWSLTQQSTPNVNVNVNTASPSKPIILARDKKTMVLKKK